MRKIEIMFEEWWKVATDTDPEYTLPPNVVDSFRAGALAERKEMIEWLGKAIDKLAEEVEGAQCQDEILCELREVKALLTSIEKADL